MFQVFTWTLTVVAIVGVVLNIRHVRACFLVWMVTNIAWAIVDASRGIWAQATLHIVYWGLSVWGWYHWGKRRDQQVAVPRVSDDAPVRDGSGREPSA
jgi:nicotinamide riboside transporter PnuC